MNSNKVAVDIVFDTNIWVAIMNTNDTNYAKAVALALKYKKVVLPDFILQEAMSVIKLKIGIEVCALFYKMMTDNQDIKVIKIDIHFTQVYDEMLLYKDLSFVDSALLSLYKSGDYKIITLDKNLAKHLK